MKFRSIKKAVAVLLVCAFACCFSVFSSALDTPATGSVTVDVTPETEGIVLRLYEVADVVNGEFVMNDEFAAAGVDITNLPDADAAQVAAEELQTFAESSSLTTGIDVAIDSDGKAVFSGLSVDKVYLIYQAEMGMISIQSMLVQVPVTNDTSTVYDITVAAKFADNSDAYISAVILNKVDDSQKPLQGAVFAFQSKEYYTDASIVPDDADKGSDSNGDYYWKAYGPDLTTNEYGQIVVEKIPFGTYRFIEVKAPDGYILDSTPHEFELNTAGSVQVENGVYSVAKGTIGELTVINESVPPESSTPPPASSVSPPPSEAPVNPPVLTGDSMNVLPFLFAAVAAAFVIVLAVKRSSRKER